MPTRLRVLVLACAALLLAALGGALWARAALRGSLPALEGEHALPGLSAPVTVARDGLGIPTVRGRTRADVARATGFLHAQDRFFQMDLARRRAAGELSALVGARALPLDREIRIHRFRAQAQRAAALLRDADRTVLDAYTAGVNAGLEALGAEPFEYFLLRQDPSPWRAEDTLLVVLSMFITLQDTEGEYEATLATMAAVLPGPLFEFLAPRGSDWDTPLVGGPFPQAPIPGPEIYDARSRLQLPGSKSRIPRDDRVFFGHSGVGRTASGIGSWDLGVASGDSGVGNWNLGLGIWDLGLGIPDLKAPPDAALGSNNFAVSAALTSGGALVANDMHLGIRVPNIWYRAALEWPDPADPAHVNRMIGVTLPGVPAVVAGSNTHVAWGFTNTYADWSDIVLLEVDPARPDHYRTPHGWRSFERHTEIIQVAGGDDVRHDVVWTVWGPLLEPDRQGRPRAYRWVAHAAERLATALTPFESARTLEEAFDEANGLGTPGQNMVAADRSGRIGWTVYGSLPRRAGFDGLLPTSWATGEKGWEGWLTDGEYPRILDPPSGRIWTANARVVDGEMLARLGEGNYEIGSRARAIRERLFARNRFTAGDLLNIQLDTGAGFLTRWRDLALRALTTDATAGHVDRALFRDILAAEWGNTVEADSAAYRLTRAFRSIVSGRITAFVLAECYDADPAFDYSNVRRRDAPLFALADAQPLHLLDSRYRSWDEFLVAAVDETIAESMRGRRGSLRDRVWSEYNDVRYRHPLSGAVPLLGRWLDMPPASLPGDLYTPRVHWGSVAASQRMVVSPGREAEGILHMPTGQSGHPLSPFYANSHAAWVNGEATPFLPGATVHMLALHP